MFLIPTSSSPHFPHLRIVTPNSTTFGSPIRVSARYSFSILSSAATAPQAWHFLAMCNISFHFDTNLWRGLELPDRHHDDERLRLPLELDDYGMAIRHE